MFTPTRIIYRDIHAERFGITPAQALELAVEGELSAYYKLPSTVRVHEYKYGQTEVGVNLGTFHGLYVPLPPGIADYLVFHERHTLSDHDGTPMALAVDGPLSEDFSEHEAYMLWPVGEALVFEREKIFFLADDLKRYSSLKEKELHPTERRSIGQLIGVLAAEARIDLSEPYGVYEALSQSAARNGLEIPSQETVAKYLKQAATLAKR